MSAVVDGIELGQDDPDNEGCGPDRRARSDPLPGA